MCQSRNRKEESQHDTVNTFGHDTAETGNWINNVLCGYQLEPLFYKHRIITWDEIMREYNLLRTTKKPHPPKAILELENSFHYKIEKV